MPIGRSIPSRVCCSLLLLALAVSALLPGTAMGAWHRVGAVGVDGVPDPDTLGVIGGVARRADGSYLVGDLSSQTARIVDSDGTVLRRLTGASGIGAPLASMSDVAIGPGGAMYLLDPAACLVHVLNPSGVQLETFGACGMGDGEFPPNSAFGMGVAADGTVWVADTLNSRIVRFDPARSPLPTLGTGAPGNALGEFAYPSDVSFLPDGSAWVSEAANNRLQHVSAAGAGLATIDGATLSPPTIGITRVVARADGSFLTADFDINNPPVPTGTVRRISADGSTSMVLSSGNGIGTAGRVANPFGIAEDPDGSVVVGDQSGQLQRLSASGGAATMLVPSARPADNSHARPFAVAVASDGAVGVVDARDGRLRVFEADGTLRFATPIGGFNTPRGVVAAPDGSWWVVDTFGFPDNRVVRVAANGTLGGHFGTGAGGGDQELSSPEGAVLDTSGDYILVADGNNSRIQVVDVDTLLSVDRFGSNGSGDGQFNRPVGLAFGPDGKLYVADQYMQRIQRFTRTPGGPGLPPTFAFDAVVVGGWGDERGRFQQINAIAFDPDGRLVVVDQELGRIQWFDRDTGELVDFLAVPGRGDGQLFRAVGIAFRPNGQLVVADTGNARVQVLAPGPAPAPPPAEPDDEGSSPTDPVPPPAPVVVLQEPVPAPRDDTVPIGAVSSLRPGAGSGAVHPLETDGTPVAWVASGRPGALVVRGTASDAGGGTPTVRIADLDGAQTRSSPSGGAMASVSSDGTWEAVVTWRSGAHISGAHLVSFTDLTGNSSTARFILRGDTTAPRIAVPTRITRAPLVRFGVQDSGSGALQRSVFVRSPAPGRTVVRRIVLRDRVGNARSVVLRVRRAR